MARVACEPKEANCIEIFQPVCGTDDITYGNKCFAEAACQYEGSIPGECCKDKSRKCKKRKCKKKYSDAKKLECKKTCDVCDGLPPSPPSSPPLPPSPPPAPSPLACEDNNIPGLGSYWCKLNTHYATEAASERFCNDKKFKVKCKKTCGLCN